MRIRDWSSDGCSSDLQAIVGGNDRGVRRSYGLRPNEILIDPRQPVATQSRNFRAHNWLKTDVAGAADQGCAQAYLEVLDGGLTLDQMGKGLRSEEHTSELQSLMRISYAGFCLKKKTHINIILKVRK